MADAAVRSKKPATSKRTPAGGAPTAPHTAAEASDARIDVDKRHRHAARHVGRHPPRGARDDQGPGVLARRRPEHARAPRARAHPAAPARRARRRRAARSRRSTAARRTTARTSPASRSSSPPTRACRSSPGVQWGLFGSAVLQLGTKEHHDKWLPGIMSLEIPGAFAMTETGHGSDVAAIGTTATYDPETEEFVIHTPFRGAWKDYLGNAALHGIAATVFAQLITSGVNHGVHCFYVPLRDENGDFLPGIGGEDDGAQGRPQRHRQRPAALRPRPRAAHEPAQPLRRRRRRRHVLEPTSPAPAAASSRCSARSFRVACRSTAPRRGHRRSALYIAITYANQRRQFDSGAGTDEVVLLDYGKHQRRLLTRLATTYAQIFAHDEFLRKFDGVFSGAADTDADREDLETLAAALKPLSTWHALDTLQEAREACGGAGFLAENRLVGLRARPRRLRRRSRATTTCCCSWSASGCSATTPSSSRARMPRPSRAYAVGQTAGKVFHGAGLRQLGQAVADFGSTARVGRARAARRPAARAARRPRAADGRRHRGRAASGVRSCRPPRRRRCSTRTSPS